jgi:steroid delta-isomerase-like uncharacterized protein
MSVEENKKIAHEFFNAAWNRGDFDTLRRLAAEDSIDHSPMGTEKGVESFLHVVTGFREAFPDVKLTIEDEIAEGDRVVHRWRLNGTSQKPFMGIPPTGKPTVFNGTTIVRLENGKVAERWASLDMLGLLTQLGAIPPMGGPPPQH